MACNLGDSQTCLKAFHGTPGVYHRLQALAPSALSGHLLLLTTTTEISLFQPRFRIDPPTESQRLTPNGNISHNIYISWSQVSS